MERASDDPTVTTVVAGSDGDQHTVAEEVRIAIRQHDGDCTTRIFHQGGEVDAGACRELIPMFRLFGGKDGDDGHGRREGLLSDQLILDALSVTLNRSEPEVRMTIYL
jgi:hypothetical protein